MAGQSSPTQGDNSQPLEENTTPDSKASPEVHSLTLQRRRSTPQKSSKLTTDPIKPRCKPLSMDVNTSASVIQPDGSGPEIADVLLFFVGSAFLTMTAFAKACFALLPMAILNRQMILHLIFGCSMCRAGFSGRLKTILASQSLQFSMLCWYLMTCFVTGHEPTNFFFSLVLLICMVMVFLGKHYLMAYHERNRVPLDQLWKTSVGEIQRRQYRLYILGSGGHTTELLGMMYRAPPMGLNVFRRWVITEGDLRSYKLVLEFEEWFSKHSGLGSGDYDVCIIPRARKVHQSFFTTPWTFMCCVLKIRNLFPKRRNPCRFPAIFEYPDFIITNGPGTGFAVGLVAWVMKCCFIMGANRARVIFIESIARVETLSLTGKLFYKTNIAERFVVQHQSVHEKYPGTHLESMFSTRGEPLGP